MVYLNNADDQTWQELSNSECFEGSCTGETNTFGLYSVTSVSQDVVVPGCMDAEATNLDSEANIDDGTCDYIPLSFSPIPMDQNQNDHLKAYGIAFWSLQNGDPLNWLLNYKGGSFLLEGKESIQRECMLRGVSYYTLDGSQINNIYKELRYK